MTVNGSEMLVIMQKLKFAVFSGAMVLAAEIVARETWYEGCTQATNPLPIYLQPVSPAIKALTRKLSMWHLTGHNFLSDFLLKFALLLFSLVYLV